ncbi:MAG: winged helix DNA-binding domain-containing protein [Micromonosporaceae bacterium]
MKSDVLGVRERNRALLARQLLLTRDDQGPLDAVGQLVGMQAQAPQAPYVGLWSRLTDFDPHELSKLLTERQVVRIGVMRGTVHLVTSDDCLLLRPWLQPIYDRTLTANPAYRKAIDGVNEEVVDAARELIDETPRTNAELRAFLASRWPDRDAAALVWGLRALLPCVQVPPRGLWGASGQATVTTAPAWLGRPLATDPSPSPLVLRYLAAYGPASVQDMQTWCGLTRLGPHFEELRPSLRVFRSESGAELFDLPDAPRPSAETPAPVRFLPEYDNLLRSHQERTHVMSSDARTRLATKNDSPRPTLLVDGLLAGGWRLDGTRKTATLTIDPFVPLSAAAQSDVTAEAERLLGFAAPDRTYDIRLAAS